MIASIVTTKIAESHQSLVINRPSSGLSVKGRIGVPGDKSISHRALMLGALAIGETTIEGLLLGEDPRTTASCFSLLGADISPLNSELVKVRGLGLGKLQEPSGVLDAGNSGTTMRLMLGILASTRSVFLASLGIVLWSNAPCLASSNPSSKWGQKFGEEKGANLHLWPYKDKS